MVTLTLFFSSRNRRARGRGHFDQIEALFLRHPKGGVHLENAQLRTVCPDDANGTDADHAVDPHAFGSVLNTEILYERKRKTRTPVGIRVRRRSALERARPRRRIWTPAARLACVREGQRVGPTTGRST